MRVRNAIGLTLLATALMVGGTVFSPVPTQAGSGWTIAYPLSTDTPSASGALGASGSAPGGSNPYRVEVWQGGSIAATADGTSYFGNLWNTLVGSSFVKGPVTLYVTNKYANPGDRVVWASVSFEFD